jgi:hypothetical protein
MSQPHFEELLSAYLDGELSPVEQAELKRHLQTDPALQEQLRELEELSAAIQAFPRLSAPESLSAAVLARLDHPAEELTDELTAPDADAGSLSAGKQHATATPHAARPATAFVPSATARRRVWPVLTTALSLLVAVTAGGLWLQQSLHRETAQGPLPELASAEPQAHTLNAPAPNSRDQNSRTQNSLARKQSPAPAAQGIARQETPQTKTLTSEPLITMSRTRSSPSPMAPVSPPVLPTAERVFRPEAAQADAQTMGKEQAAPPAGTDGSQAPEVPVVLVTRDEIRQKIGELERLPQPGYSIKVPAALRTQNGESPIVVVFTVVDVSQAMNRLQVLLQRERIRSQNQAGLPAESELNFQSLTAVSMELEMDGTEMASVLERVPALDAVMYVAQNDATGAAPQSAASGIAPEQAFSDRPIRHRSLPGASGVPTPSPGALSVEQPVLFRFQPALTGGAGSAAQFSEARSPDTQTAPRSPALAPARTGQPAPPPAFSLQPPLQASRQPVLPVPQNQKSSPAASAVLSQQAGNSASSRYRAWIHFQQPARDPADELK